MHNYRLLQKVANYLLITLQKGNDIGLLNGQIGSALFFYSYSRFTNNDLYYEYADDIIDYIFSKPRVNIPLGFSSGLTGICWGLDYLINHDFIEGVPDELFSEIDLLIFEQKDNLSLVLSDKDFFSPGLYCLFRCKTEMNNSLIQQRFNSVLSLLDRFFASNSTPNLSYLNSILYFLFSISQNIDVNSYISYLLEKIVSKLNTDTYSYSDFNFYLNLIHSNEKFLDNISNKYNKRKMIISEFDILKDSSLKIVYPDVYFKNKVIRNIKTDFPSDENYYKGINALGLLNHIQQ